MASSEKLLKKFGKNVRAYRTEQQLSQERLVQKPGLGRTYISGIERGKRNPRSKIFIKLQRR